MHRIEGRARVCLLVFWGLVPARPSLCHAAQSTLPGNLRVGWFSFLGSSVLGRASSLRFFKILTKT